MIVATVVGIYHTWQDNLDALLLTAIVVGTYDAWQIVALRAQGAFVRFQQLDSEAFDRLYREGGPRAEDLDFFAAKLAQAGIHRVNGNKERIVFVLRWVMDHVNSAAFDSSTSPKEAFQRAQEGQGLSCGSMTLLFVAAVRAAGYTARRVQLVRSVLNNTDTHVTVEVLLNGRWVIFDPTFNTSLKKKVCYLEQKRSGDLLWMGTRNEFNPSSTARSRIRLA